MLLILQIYAVFLAKNRWRRQIWGRLGSSLCLAAKQRRLSSWSVYGPIDHSGSQPKIAEDLLFTSQGDLYMRVLCEP